LQKKFEEKLPEVWKQPGRP